jgi:hypothetical protein
MFRIAGAERLQEGRRRRQRRSRTESRKGFAFHLRSRVGDDAVALLFVVGRLAVLPLDHRISLETFSHRHRSPWPGIAVQGSWRRD